ncbi:patched family-domain-containing protein [Dunaliella salina]|uniref:Patched family-domain-containing protein n=1 Tax=Dunaliella salina TaxID=3046 RepID=A0ABZ3KC07_DUNSA|nr:patched family-domain-containing protein [Dunaliella salina]|eukprot:KAF5826705.1 patched family-domain-containing protein [Dunaliella salina]
MQVHLWAQMTGFSQNYEDATWAVELTDDIRARAAQAAPALDAIAFSPAFFSYDSYRVVVDNTLRTVIAACVAVFVVMVIMLASIQGSLLVLAMVVLSDVGLFGFMHFAGLNLNSITFIILVIAVGIAVDFSGHVCRAFLVEQGTRKERAEKALYHIGGEVLNGAFSTWLAVIVLAGANHYIFHAMPWAFVSGCSLSTWLLSPVTRLGSIFAASPS